MKKLNADLRDAQFKANPNAVYITGYFGDSWMNQFGGVGYSTKEYKMKAIRIDNVVYVPDRHYTMSTEKEKRDYASYPMIESKVSIPASCIVKA